MTRPKLGETFVRTESVGVILCENDLRRALRMRNPPDFFELRLDGLANIADRVESSIPLLKAPLIVTARVAAEGGIKKLSARIRRELLNRFLPFAHFLDVEIRSRHELASALENAHQLGVHRIISLHDFRQTPPLVLLEKELHCANLFAPDIVKVATRTDTPAELARLLDFFDRHAGEQRIAAMGIGKLGRASRLALLLRGSALNYGFMGKQRIAGQLSIAELRTRIRRLL